MYEATTVTDSGAIITCTHSDRSMALAELMAMLIPDINEIEIHQNGNLVIVAVNDTITHIFTVKKV